MVGSATITSSGRTPRRSAQARKPSAPAMPPASSPTEPTSTRLCSGVAPRPRAASRTASIVALAVLDGDGVGVHVEHQPPVAAALPDAVDVEPPVDHVLELDAVGAEIGEPPAEGAGEAVLARLAAPGPGVQGVHARDLHEPG